ncbi:PH domain-containing protein [Flavobacterium tegetincola]|uniref:PH domain-containing protein n=1 Tax=Flavobacterium tegetincola TaxID=150172 RepID=UPI000429698F|nr:PH domain-containing protein [Flavobacterium tegetincola]
MNDHIRKFLNEEQDPKAIEKITSKLVDLLMKNEEVGYIGVQKKPVTVFPDSIVLTDRRIIICKPKNLGFSMDFVDYNWDTISHTTVNESILGSEFSFTTKTNISTSIDYLPKIQARKIYTFAKEQLETLKNNSSHVEEAVVEPEMIQVSEPVQAAEIAEVIEEIEAEEVINFAEIIPVAQSGYRAEKQFPDVEANPTENAVSELSQDELFEKLQKYKKLLDNGLILQGEYDALKKEVLSKM